MSFEKWIVVIRSFKIFVDFMYTETELQKGTENNNQRSSTDAGCVGVVKNSKQRANNLKESQSRSGFIFKSVDIFDQLSFVFSIFALLSYRSRLSTAYYLRNQFHTECMMTDDTHNNTQNRNKW